MSGRDRSNLVLVVGWWLSLAAHAALGLGAVRYGALSAKMIDKPSSVTPKLPPIPIDEPPLVRLGVAQSDAKTMTWLDHEAPVDHEAPRSTTNQPALTIAPAGPHAPSGMQVPQPQQARASQPAVSKALQERARETGEDAAKLLAAARRRIDDLAAEMERIELTRTRRVPEAASSESAPAPAAQGQSDTGDGGLPGQASDRESMAVSVMDAARVRPGRVVAAQGLEIKTIAPRWSTTTLMTHRPKNPTLRITFRRDGTVKDAEFVREGAVIHDAGSLEVNQPLLAAVYAWTAKGKALDDLDAKDAEAGVTIMMTILLSG